MKIKHITVFLFIFFLLSTQYSYSQQRAKVSISNGTLVTDRGTLLRGAHVSTDNGTLPTKAQVVNVKNYGLNTIHLYAECSDNGAPGTKKAAIDSIIKWTREASLYCVMTIGGCSKNGAHDLNFVKGFWNLYAPKYKNETHVIYEIMNEPFGWSSPYDAATLNMEKVVYNQIRALAPNTHIQLMCYSQPKKPTVSIAELQGLGITNWNDASLSIHGYENTTEEIRNYIQTVNNAGYAVMVTEPASIEDKYVHRGTTRSFEKDFVSYTHFINVQDLNNKPEVFKNLIEQSSLRWTPDFGVWPNNVTQTQFVNPFVNLDNWYYDEGFGFASWGFTNGRTLSYFGTNSYTSFYDVDFKNGAESFSCVAASPVNVSGSIEIRLDKLNGPLVGTCLINSTGSKDNYQTFTCNTTHFTGIHRIYFILKGGFPLNIQSFKFKQAPITTEPKGPYTGTPINIAGTIEVENYDKGGEGISYHDTEAANLGGAYRTDGVDIGTVAGSNFVGWTATGEWMEYTVKVTKTSLYDFKFLTSSLGGGGVVSLTIDGNPLLINIAVPSTGDWNTYISFTKSATLNQGMHVIRLLINNFGFNIDKIIVTESTCSATITSPSNAFCAGSSLVLTANAGASYKWMNGTTAVGTAATYTATAAGSYTVEITNASGCKNTSAPKVLSVTASITWYQDADNDGKGDPTKTIAACTKPAGYVAVAGDGCPTDANKTAPGNCGCNKTEASCIDCAGVPNGTAIVDACGKCAGGTTGVAIITDPSKCITTNIPSIDGPICVTTGTSNTYMLNAGNLSIASINWWTNSGATVTKNAANPKQVQINFPSYSNGTNATITAGVNLNAAPWYTEYSLLVKVGECTPGAAPQLRASASPLPFNSLTTVSLENNEFINSIRIVDMNGIEVFNQNNINKNSFELGAELPTGMYIAYVTSNKGTSIVKLVKNN